MLVGSAWNVLLSAATDWILYANDSSLSPEVFLNSNRRHILKSGALAAFGSGIFRRMDKIDGMQTGSGANGGSLADIVKARGKGASEKMFVDKAAGAEGPPEP